MISKHILKEIITTNEEFILRHTGDIVHNGLVKACKWLAVNEGNKKAPEWLHRDFIL